MEPFTGSGISLLISAVISGGIIWAISHLNLGLSVLNFGWAMLAGVLIGVFTSLIMSVVPPAGGVIQFAINLVVSAAVIFAWGRLLRGLTVRGYQGALIAAVSIAAINALLSSVFSLGLSWPAGR